MPRARERVSASTLYIAGEWRMFQQPRSLWVGQDMKFQQTRRISAEYLKEYEKHRPISAVGGTKYEGYTRYPHRGMSGGDQKRTRKMCPNKESHGAGVAIASITSALRPLEDERPFELAAL